ncbi:MAG: Smr/MutS family protein [Holosporales bacterium]|jgi:DNA-nicking Smr family endonuclease|nr:Smr/MutS family protein [Holosporales bacterium]
MSKIEDLSLWHDYKKSVKKLDKSDVVPRYYITPTRPKKTTEHGFDHDKIIDNFLQKKSPNAVFQVVKLNRSERRKFGAEATIDLHGYTREISVIMRQFCLNCIVNKIKDIVVISGKGEGIIKQALVEWILTNPLIVVGYFEIKDAKGGIGSYGLRLRIGIK